MYKIVKYQNLYKKISYLNKIKQLNQYTDILSFMFFYQ
jgi:hypothetical protein